MEISNLLSALEGVEGGLADLYGWFSERLSEDGEVSGVFFRLSLQEMSHLNLVRYGRKLARQTPQAFQPVTVDGGLVEELVSRKILVEA